MKLREINSERIPTQLHRNACNSTSSVQSATKRSRPKIPQHLHSLKDDRKSPNHTTNTEHAMYAGCKHRRHQMQCSSDEDHGKAPPPSKTPLLQLKQTARNANTRNKSRTRAFHHFNPRLNPGTYKV
jgi:hypothetical protein